MIYYKHTVSSGTYQKHLRYSINTKIHTSAQVRVKYCNSKTSNSPQIMSKKNSVSREPRNCTVWHKNIIANHTHSNRALSYTLINRNRAEWLSAYNICGSIWAEEFPHISSNGKRKTDTLHSTITPTTTNVRCYSI